MLVEESIQVWFASSDTRKLNLSGPLAVILNSKSIKDKEKNA